MLHWGSCCSRADTCQQQPSRLQISSLNDRASMVSAYFIIQSNIICSAQHIIPHQHVDHSIRLSMLRMSSTQSSSITSNLSSASKPEMHRVRLSLSTTQLGHLNHLPNWSPSRRSHPCAVGLKNKCQQGWYQIRPGNDDAASKAVVQPAVQSKGAGAGYPLRRSPLPWGTP